MVQPLAFLLSFLALILWSEPSLAFRSVAVGSAVPAVSVRNLEGREVRLAFGRRPVVLLFWRANQSFSLQALGDLEEIKKEFSRRGVEVVAIAEGGAPPASVQGSVKSLGLSYPVYQDYRRLVEEKFGVIVFPSTGIVGPDGRLKFYLPSRNSNYRQILQARLKLELGQMDEKGFERRMKQLGEELGGERVKAQGHLKAGLRLSRQAKPREALQEFNQALSLDADLVDAHLAMGYAYLDLEEPKTAQREFEWVLKQHPDSPGGRLGLGISIARLGDLDRGIEILKEAVQINPDPVQGYYELGRAYEKKGDLQQAMHAYKWAVRKLLQGRR